MILFIAGGLALIAAIMTGTSISVINSRDRTLASSERELGNTALLLAKHIEQQIESLDHVQKSLIEQMRSLGIASSEDLERKMSADGVQLLLENRISGFSHIDTLVIINSDGNLVNASSGRSNATLSFVDRDYFKALKSDPQLPLYVSAPVRGRLGGDWKVIIARKFNAPNGALLGLIVGAIKLSVFEDYFRSIALGEHSMVGLQRNDGVMLARHPRIDAIIGRSFGGAISALGAHERGVTRLAGRMEGKELILAAHRLNHYPLIATVAMDSAFVLDNWRKEAGILIGLGIVTALMIAALAFVMMRQFSKGHSLSQKNIAIEKQRLDTALSNMSQGLVLFDSSERLVICNNRYLEMYGLSPDVVKPGCSLRDIIAHRKETGSFSGDVNKFYSARSNRLAQRESFGSVAETADGRFIRIVIRPLSGGGWVATHEDITEQQRLLRAQNETERLLREQTLQLDAALNNMKQGLCMFDAEGRIILFNQRYVDMMDMPGVELNGYSLLDLFKNGRVTGQFTGDPTQFFTDLLVGIRAGQSSTKIMTSVDGRALRVIDQPMPDGGWVATYEDITEQRRAEVELDETKRFLDSIIENIPIAVVVKDARTRKFVLVNRAFEALVGLPRHDLLGQSAFDIYRREDAELIDKYDNEALRGMAQAKFAEVAMETPMRGSHILATSRIVIKDAQDNAKYLIVVIEDVTERRKSEQKIAFMAHHDALTGLVNRAAVVQKIEDAAARHRRWGDRFSILLLDLDRFKNVNDSLGHPAGDVLLQEVGARLKVSLRETDVLARLGGDEFVIIQGNEPDPRQAASALANRIIESIMQPFNIESNEINIGTSVGIALAPEHSTDPDSLLKMADMALYSAKSAGRGAYHFFDVKMIEAANARHEVERELRHAIQNDELELYYQPIVDTKTRRIAGAEALIRWRHPTKGIILPDRFIPLAEETGLIAEVGEWVLHTACAEAATWPVDVKVAINLSALQFRRANLADVVMYALARSGLPPERLELEITETALIESAAECLPALRQFKNLGISVALDDFGTGYSSLSQLTIFPFDKIKIDKSFIHSITKHAACAAIISATLTLAKSLEIETTAEGVETEEQYRILRLAGVTSVQGYLFKRPAPASEIDFDCVYGGAELEDAA
jgi:diguanylate cyclase (GGDEF)-like protein/PAS domain S-box-containing protein